MKYEFQVLQEMQVGQKRHIIIRTIRSSFVMLVVNKHNVIKHGLNCLVIDKSIIMLEKLEALVSSIGGLVYCRAIFIT